MKSAGLLADMRKIASHPARGAWIEIVLLPIAGVVSCVAPRKGCVD